jgi:hypothetical protein
LGTANIVFSLLNVSNFEERKTGWSARIQVTLFDPIHLGIGVVVRYENDDALPMNRAHQREHVFVGEFNTRGDLDNHA